MRWLTQQERDRLVYRLEVDRSSKDATDEVTAWAAFKMASCDPKTWLLCSVLYCNYIAASVTNFFPVVGKKFLLMHICLCLKLTIIGSFWPGFQPHYHTRHHLPSLRPLLLRYLDNWLAFR